MMRHIRNIIAVGAGILTLTVASRAQEINIRPLNLMGGDANAIYPFVYDSTLYFASDQKWDLMKTYYDQRGRHLYQLFKMKLKGQIPSGTPTPYFVRADRPYNQYAICFDPDGSAYITQNNMNASVVRGAPVSIYEYDHDGRGAEGTRLSSLPAKSSCGMASISPDGSYMIFASDMRGGEGRTDLYYCLRTTGGWGEPCNMGTVINTPGIETSPYIHPSGKIFFASDGRDDSQGLDLFYTYKTKDGFAEPVKFDDVVNSMKDDYGLYYSQDEKWGYITSNRDGKDNIYFFERTFPTFEECEPMEEPEMCYTLYESSAENYDTTTYECIWKFSDGVEAKGIEVDHCFEKVGKYTIELNVIDRTTDEEMFSLAQYELEIELPDQVRIVVPENIKAGKPVTFTVNTSGLKDFPPLDFYWEMGNGEQIKGSQATTTFATPGTYRVKCGTIDARTRVDKRCTYVDVTVEK